jgi:hypothetical protein
MLSAKPHRILASYVKGDHDTELIGSGEATDVPSPDVTGTISLVVRIDLMRRVALRAQIVSQDGKPLGGMRFRVIGADGSRVSKSGPSDAEGNALSRRLLRFGDYSLAVDDDEHYSDAAPFPFAGWVPGFEWTCRLVAIPYPLVTGTVLLADGRPAKGATLAMITSGRAGEIDWSTRGETVADEAGRFSFRLTEDGDVTVSAALPGHRAETVRLGGLSIRGPGRATEIRLRDGRDERRVRGIILDPDDRPLPDARVVLLKDSEGERDPEQRVYVPLDSEGRYELGLLPRTLYVIRVEHRDYVAVTLDVTAETFDGGPIRFKRRR